jgi:hypothetical protein
MKVNQLTLDDTIIRLGNKKFVQADFNYTIFKFGPIVSICYIVCHVYTFIVLMNFWNNFDMLTLIFGTLHLTVPLYTIALSSYQAPIAQFIIYYFSSTVTTIASILLFIEAAILGLGLLAQGTNESESMGIFTGSFTSNVLVIMGPFAGMTAFLQIAIVKY